jgi:hypothetical protein
MEKVEVLLEKLRQQFNQQAGRDQLLVTLQLLQAEIMRMHAQTPVRSMPRKISVIFPGANSLSVHASPEIDEPMQREEKIIEVLQVDEHEIEAELQALRKNAELKNDLSLKGRPAPEQYSDPLDEIPTMATHQAYLPIEITEIPTRENIEVHDKINADEASLNDKHRSQKSELVDRLQDQPVKDLKKAIGINDRYLYINELFNGNEAMFERTLKTLNGFSILPEAEYWIQRELRLKMGWKDDNPLVQQFVQLVKRRFS